MYTVPSVCCKWCKGSGRITSYNFSTLSATQINTAREFIEEKRTAEDKPRYNEFGIQMIPERLSRQLFGTKRKKTNANLVDKCLADLKKYNFLNIQPPAKEVNLDLPPLFGNSLEEHFWFIGEQQSGPYKNLVLELFNNYPEVPTSWKLEPGWTRYDKNKIETVTCPLEDAFVFDVEVCCKAGPFPTIATAMSNKAWYSWVSPDLINNETKHIYSPDYLIPLETNRNTKRVVIGHNVSYDRARVKEQYHLDKSDLRFIDTMSLHVSVSGVTSYQKALLKAGLGEEEWSKLSSLNSLAKIYELYCQKNISKEERTLFLTGSLLEIKNNFQSLMTYCANDVKATYEVMCKLFPLFLQRFPHPVTLAGMLELQSTYVPVNKNWKKYINESKEAYSDLDTESKSLLSQSANEACKLLHNSDFKNDLWLWDQDWSTKNLTLNKSTCKPYHKVIDLDSEDMVDKKLSDLKKLFENQSKLSSRLPARSGHLLGYPTWYKKLCDAPNYSNWVPEPENMSTSMKIVPKLLRLTWKLLPLHHERGHGWGYLKPCETVIPLQKIEIMPLEELKKYCLELKDYVCNCVSEDSEFSCTRRKKNKLICKARIGTDCGLVKLPHKDGPHLNVGNPLARDFINKFSENELSGASSQAQRIIEISRKLSYWRNNRERIENQLVCWLSKSDLPNELWDCEDIGVILPQLIVCGTLTRRAVESTWMTASNALSDRIGSELRGVVQAPPDYCLVGADVDSEELWIASLLGDADAAGLHGATPFGWMTLNGQKADASDMHSVTAQAVGISRSHAKVLNYARIYGAGQKFSERLLKQFNPELTNYEASQKAAKMMLLTKGKKVFKLKNDVFKNISERIFTKDGASELCKVYQKSFEELFESCYWSGGTESAMFNCLEKIANGTSPETPFLNSKLSRALEPMLDKEDKYSSTRINWVVQSGAVDFLHLMLVSMRWLLGPKPRFCLSFHDEVRYLVKNDNKYQVALALHVTNLLARAFCVSRLGMTDLPQSIAFFSSVDIDLALRKDSSDDNKSPSNPFGLSKGYGVPKGESLDIYDSLEKANGIIGLRSEKVFV